MGDTVLVEIPVSPETARRLQDAGERERAGQMLDEAWLLRGFEGDPLFHAIRELKREARAAGLTDEDIDAELAAHKAERRLRRERGGERGSEG